MGRAECMSKSCNLKSNILGDFGAETETLPQLDNLSLKTGSPPCWLEFSERAKVGLFKEQVKQRSSPLPPISRSADGGDGGRARDREGWVKLMGKGKRGKQIAGFIVTRLAKCEI